MPVSKRVDGVAQVAQQMPAVGHLESIRRALAGAVSIGTGPVARDHLHAGVLAQPGSQDSGLAVRQTSRTCYQESHDLPAIPSSFRTDIQMHRYATCSMLSCLI